MVRKTLDVPMPAMKTTPVRALPFKTKRLPEPKPDATPLGELLPAGTEEDDDAGHNAFNLEDQLMAGDGERTDIDKYLEHMLKPQNIHHLTDLNDDEITAFSILGPISTRYKLKVLQGFLFEKLRLRVSKNRKGRGEVVRIAQRVIQPEAPQTRRFFDFRR